MPSAFNLFAQSISIKADEQMMLLLGENSHDALGLDSSGV